MGFNPSEDRSGMAPPAQFRAATHSDAAAIARIYNQGIEDRVATFETKPRTEADILTALRERADRFPTVVAEVAGEVVAVAWCSEYRPRDCYSGVAEFSVYTERANRGRGLGYDLMLALAAAAEAGGFWKLVSRVFPENQSSLRLLNRLGFHKVGVYRRHGKLDGRWRDCVIVEKLIGESLD